MKELSVGAVHEINAYTEFAGTDVVGAVGTSGAYPVVMVVAVVCDAPSPYLFTARILNW